MITTTANNKNNTNKTLPFALLNPVPVLLSKLNLGRSLYRPECAGGVAGLTLSMRVPGKRERAIFQAQVTSSSGSSVPGTMYKAALKAQGAKQKEKNKQRWYGVIKDK